MPRKPNGNIQIGLRIRESLHRKLKKESEKHGVSINREMSMRLEDSFRTDAARSIENSASALAGPRETP
jgi:predicted HicB family RNase H-like nuclease